MGDFHGYSVFSLCSSGGPDESRTRVQNISNFIITYAIATWLTILNCLSGRATNHIQRTDWPSSPKFSSWEYIDSWRFRRYSVPSISSEPLNLTRSPARWCVVLVSVYLRLGSNRRSVTIVVSYFIRRSLRRNHTRDIKSSIPCRKPLRAHKRHVIVSTCTVLCDGPPISSTTSFLRKLETIGGNWRTRIAAPLLVRQMLSQLS